MIFNHIKKNFTFFFFYIRILFLNRDKKFQYIYRNNLWGKRNTKFFSGTGSHQKNIINPYITKVITFLKLHKFSKVVDCGCGDFNIGKEIYLFTKSYIGLDIVKGLINYNKKKFIHKKLEFIIKDILIDKLPKADIFLIRQVLQHLSNNDIKLFLKNIKYKCKFLIVTEHWTSKKDLPNKNFITNFNIRKGSQILLHKQPFNIKFKSMQKLLEVSVGKDKGFVTTFVYEF
jgi:hypothetical protein